MKETVRIGYVGLGRRGYSVLDYIFSEMSDVEIVAVCDYYEDRLQKAKEMLEGKGKTLGYATTNYDELLADSNIDAIVIMSGWDTHVELAKKAMLAGKYTAIEVGCAYDLQECHELIDIYERTKSPLMMLENCCYGRREMMVLKLVKEGRLGEVVHCRGAYSHYLPDDELFLDIDNPVTHYRINEYIHRNCEQYPTHELLPVCKVLNINRGNRLMKLTSTASKSCGLKEYAKKKLPADSIYNNVEYKQGDIVNTLITCANGETILLTLDTTIHSCGYSREFVVRGTNGMYNEDRNRLLLGEHNGEEALLIDDEEAYKRFDHPLHEEYQALGTKGQHDGMDWLVCRAFVESVKNGTNTPIDAYDTVTAMSIASLSEMSIQQGGAPVSIPDFTRGKWMRREAPLNTKYSLDAVVEDKETPIYPEGTNK